MLTLSHRIIRRARPGRQFSFFFGQSSTPQQELSADQQALQKLKDVYLSKILPAEQRYGFDTFFSPAISPAEFDAKPMVLLLGQYSTGKTSFINHLLQRPYPSSHVGVEPTTDKFLAVMDGTEDRVIPGNTLSVDQTRPFCSLAKFGTSFFTKFQVVECDAPILKHVTFVDTPGVLSGEKQRIGRSYDFESVCKVFADRADMTILMCDAHKLDISDEFKRVIEGLKSSEEKLRVVLNKANQVTPNQLIRVYGALMWSLSKVLPGAEVVRVYMGSFGQPNADSKLGPLAEVLEEESAALLADLSALPRNSVIRKVNDIIKRARLLKLHAHTIGHLHSQMPTFFKKQEKRDRLIQEIPDIFRFLCKELSVPFADFPPVDEYRLKLESVDFSSLSKLDPRLIRELDEALNQDLPSIVSLLNTQQLDLGALFQDTPNSS